MILVWEKANSKTRGAQTVSKHTNERWEHVHKIPYLSLCFVKSFLEKKVLTIVTIALHKSIPSQLAFY